MREDLFTNTPQMLERIPNVVTMSEPDALTTAFPGGSNLEGFPQWMLDAPEKLTAAAVLAQCKPSSSRRVDHVIIKPRAICLRQTLGIARELPWVRHLFMFRAPGRVFKATCPSNKVILWTC